MYKVGDKVMVNLPTGTQSGEIIRVFDPPRGHEYYEVRVEKPYGPLLMDTAVVNPWDVFPEDDDEYKERMAAAIDADIEREQNWNGE